MAASALLAACALDDFASAQPKCETNVIIGLTPDTDEAIAEIARATAATIERVAEISAEAAAFAVSTAGADSECSAVIERLRGDSRVRFVELDTRRGASQ